MSSPGWDQFSDGTGGIGGPRPGMVTWRPSTASRVASAGSAIVLTVVAAVFVVAAFGGRSGQITTLTGIVLSVVCAVFAIMSASAPAMFVRIDGGELRVRNHFWQDRVFPLGSVVRVRPGERGLVIERESGTRLNAWAVTNPGWRGPRHPGRAVAIAAAIEQAAAQQRLTGR